VVRDIVTATNFKLKLPLFEERLSWLTDFSKANKSLTQKEPNELWGRMEKILKITIHPDEILCHKIAI